MNISLLYSGVQQLLLELFQRTTGSFLAAVLVAISSAAAQAEMIYGVSDQEGLLVSFDSAGPGTLLAAVNITGLQPNERLRGIQWVAGVLYGLGQSSRLYTINPSTGTATMIGMGQFSPLLNGVYFGFCAAPMSQFYVISDLGQNLTINSTSGTATSGTSYSTTGISTMAYDPGNGTYYGISASTHDLYTLNPVTGAVALVGPTGANFQTVLGLAISPSTGTAYFCGIVSGQTGFYTVNTTTGAIALVGSVGSGQLTSGLNCITVGSQTPLAAPVLIDATMMNMGGMPFFQFAFSNNNPEGSFTVLSSTNLSLPLAGWSAIGTASYIGPGLFQFTDTHATDTYRFYRVHSP
ncbi:MAG TPA: DUF4394 domain-containing protein [Candidatus Sulfopaludibacter sp.]|nr:DUF4394 domain-containing protein [Candidatus Sulfopaludibacter sp.]